MKLSLTFSLRDGDDVEDAGPLVGDFLGALAAIVDMPAESLDYNGAFDSWEVRDTLGNLVGQASISDSKESGPCLEWPGGKS